MNASLEDKLAIRELLENWILWRDTGDWERFRTLWHADAWMCASWFEAPADKFIEMSKAAQAKGLSVLHMIGGSTIDVSAHRAVSQTKMTINQRATVDEVLVDVVCMGRFYDFLEKRDGRWGIVRRQGVYDKDWLNVVDPGGSLKLDPELLRAFPAAYQHLAYVQTRMGFSVKKDLPHADGEVVRALYAHGERWLGGASSPFPGQSRAD